MTETPQEPQESQPSPEPPAQPSEAPVPPAPSAESSAPPVAEESQPAPAEAPASPDVLIARPASGTIMEKAYMFDAFTAGGAVLLILAGFLPWVSISMGPFGGASQNGLNCGWRGVFPFLAGIGAAVIVFLQFQSGKVIKGTCLGVLACGAVGALITILALANIPGGAMGFGVFVSLIGGLAVTVANLALLMKDKSWAAFFIKKLK